MYVSVCQHSVFVCYIFVSICNLLYVCLPVYLKGGKKHMPAGYENRKWL